MKRSFGTSFLAVLMLIGLQFSAVRADTITTIGITPYPGFTVNDYLVVMDSGGDDATELTYNVTGEIICVETMPGAGAKAPTDDYDLKLEDDLGNDVMGGALGNRDTANAERAWPKDGATVIYTGVPTKGSLSVFRENNLVKDAEVTIRIYVKNQIRDRR
jgi:hypothetical protein